MTGSQQTEIIGHITAYELADAFLKMDKAGVKSAEYAQLKKEFISGISKTDTNYVDRLMLFVNSLSTDKPDEITITKTVTVPVNENGDYGFSQMISNTISIERMLPSKQNILFVAANPADTARLQTDKEYSEIKKRLQMATDRDSFDLKKPALAVTIEGLMQALASEDPHIVHFAGHGSSEGIFIADDQNNAISLPNTALKRLFKQHTDTVKMVILSACYSEAQAKILSELGVCVIGMGREIPDEAAIAFTVGVYLGLGEGGTTVTSFEKGLIILETKFPAQAHIPKLWQDGTETIL